MLSLTIAGCRLFYLHTFKLILMASTSSASFLTHFAIFPVLMIRLPYSLLFYHDWEERYFRDAGSVINLVWSGTTFVSCRFWLLGVITASMPLFFFPFPDLIPRGLLNLIGNNFFAITDRIPSTFDWTELFLLFMYSFILAVSIFSHRCFFFPPKSFLGGESPFHQFFFFFFERDQNTLLFYFMLLNLIGSHISFHVLHCFCLICNRFYRRMVLVMFRS